MNNPEQLPLKDIHLPDAVSWWPLATGWWLLLLALVVAAALAWWWLRATAPKRRASELRGIARIELERLEAEYRNCSDAAHIMQKLSILLRRVAMTFGPRGQVAGLSGKGWIDWLSATDVASVLDPRVLELLSVGPYQRTQGHDIEAVIHACRQWLKTFEPGAAASDSV